MRLHPITGYFLIPVLFFAMTGISFDVQAARANLPDSETTDREMLFEWSPLVRDIQAFLIEFGLLDGAADGRIDQDVQQAIRSYQRRHGLSEDGEVSRKLLHHMDTVGRPESLKNRLAEARRRQTEQARNALMTNPETRDLVDGSGRPKVTGASDIPLEACVLMPGADCLLDEALRAINAIEQTDYRDWALREVVRAQARSGHITALRSSIRRISDVRLVVVSLREAATGLVKAGKLAEAEALADTIPDDRNQARAFAGITIAIAKTGSQSVRPLLARLTVLLLRIEDRVAASEIAARVAVALAENNLQDDAATLIRRVRSDAVSAQDADTRQTLHAVAASALAQIGQVDQALELLRSAGDIGRDHIALAEAAGQLAERNRPEDALALAARLRTPRLHTLALSKIAAAQSRLGNSAGAQQTLQRAMNASLDIDRPFAADSALAEIAAAWAGLPDHTKAQAAIDKIKSRPLQAQSLWKITAKAEHDLDAKKDKAFAATQSINSAFDRAAVLTQAAILMGKHGRFSDARTLFNAALQDARTIKNDWWRARIFSRLSSALLEL